MRRPRPSRSPTQTDRALCLRRFPYGESSLVAHFMTREHGRVALLAKGAKSVTAYITHGVLSGGAVNRIMSSQLTELVITDSIQPSASVESAPNIRVVSVTDLIGEAIARTSHEQSVSSLFD